MSVSLAQGGVGLGAMWGEQLALSMLADAGFSDVEIEKVEGDVLNNCSRGRCGGREGGAARLIE